jgi:hypothetical protein
MATNAPSEPFIATIEASRKLTSIDLQFTKPISNGGSLISGYQLWRDEGIKGSPFELIYNGTDRPEILSITASGLITSFTYTFKLFSMNKIFLSETSADLEVKIGLVPSKPGQP